MFSSNICSLLIPLANLILVRPITSPPPSDGFLLQENGAYLLLESGGKIIL